MSNLSPPDRPTSPGVGLATDPGKRYGKLNQDRILYCQTPTNEHIFGVFDGHNVNGEVAADVARTSLEEYFHGHAVFSDADRDAREQVMLDAFKHAHASIINKYEELTKIKWGGQKFTLTLEKRGTPVNVYKSKNGFIVQDFGTTAVVAAVRRRPGAPHTAEPLPTSKSPVADRRAAIKSAPATPLRHAKSPKPEEEKSGSDGEKTLKDKEEKSGSSPGKKQLRLSSPPTIPSPSQDKKERKDKVRAKRGSGDGSSKLSASPPEIEPFRRVTADFGDRSTFPSLSEVKPKREKKVEKVQSEEKELELGTPAPLVAIPALPVDKEEKKSRRKSGTPLKSNKEKSSEKHSDKGGSDGEKEEDKEKKEKKADPMPLTLLSPRGHKEKKPRKEGAPLSHSDDPALSTSAPKDGLRERLESEKRAERARSHSTSAVISPFVDLEKKKVRSDRKKERREGSGGSGGSGKEDKERKDRPHKSEAAIGHHYNTVSTFEPHPLPSDEEKEILEEAEKAHVRARRLSLDEAEGRRIAQAALAAEAEAAEKASGTGEEPEDREDGAWELVLADVGDSMAFIGREGPDGELEVVEELTVRHGVLDVRELQRVLAAGAQRAESIYIQPPLSSGFAQNKLAMTRALGHKYFSKYGVIPDPHVTSYVLHPRDRYLVLCSDGISDVLNPSFILDLIHQCKHAQQGDMMKVAQVILKRAMMNWKDIAKTMQTPARIEADNASVIVVDLKRLS